MGGDARRGRSGFRRQRPVGRRVVLAVAVCPPWGDIFPVAAALSTIGCQQACRTPDCTLVNARTARSRRAVCRGPLIRLPDAAIGVPRLRAAAQAARGALPAHVVCVCLLGGHFPWSGALAPRVRTPWRPRRHFTGHRLVAVPRGDGLLRAPGPPGEARRWASAAPTVMAHVGLGCSGVSMI